MCGLFNDGSQTSTSQWVEQAKLMESYGAHCVYVVDSAGALLMDETAERIRAFKDNLGTEVGFQPQQPGIGCGQYHFSH